MNAFQFARMVARMTTAEEMEETTGANPHEGDESLLTLSALVEEARQIQTSRVIVEVTGGVAEVTDNPDDVQVDIIDHDILDDGESDITDPAGDAYDRARDEREREAEDLYAAGTGGLK
jgi:hypothetical protein